MMPLQTFGRRLFGVGFIRIRAHNRRYPGEMDVAHHDRITSAFTGANGPGERSFLPSWKIAPASDLIMFRGWAMNSAF